MEQGETRPEVGEALVVLAASEDSEFLRYARNELATTLGNYGFVLHDKEIDEIVQYLVEHAGLSDRAIKNELRERLATEGLRWF